MGFLWALQRHKANNLISNPYSENYTMLKWRVLASREASVNFFLGVLRDIWLVPDLWALQICKRTTPEKLLTP